VKLNNHFYGFTEFAKASGYISWYVQVA